MIRPRNRGVSLKQQVIDNSTSSSGLPSTHPTKMLLSLTHTHTKTHARTHESQEYITKGGDHQRFWGEEERSPSVSYLNLENHFNLSLIFSVGNFTGLAYPGCNLDLRPCRSRAAGIIKFYLAPDLQPLCESQPVDNLLRFSSHNRLFFL